MLLLAPAGGVHEDLRQNVHGERLLRLRLRARHRGQRHLVRRVRDAHRARIAARLPRQRQRQAHDRDQRAERPAAPRLQRLARGGDRVVLHGAVPHVVQQGGVLDAALARRHAAPHGRANAGPSSTATILDPRHIFKTTFSKLLGPWDTFSRALPDSNGTFCVLNHQRSVTHSVAPHCGSHCHPAPRMVNTPRGGSSSWRRRAWTSVTPRACTTVCRARSAA